VQTAECQDGLQQPAEGADRPPPHIADLPRPAHGSSDAHPSFTASLTSGNYRN